MKKLKTPYNFIELPDAMVKNLKKGVTFDHGNFYVTEDKNGSWYLETDDYAYPAITCKRGRYFFHPLEDHYNPELDKALKNFWASLEENPVLKKIDSIRSAVYSTVQQLIGLQAALNELKIEVMDMED